MLALGIPISVSFLSTLSLRRATPRLLYRVFHPTHFYPRSPCGERLLFYCFFALCNVISIHALLAESDDAPEMPTQEEIISIHALLAESDTQDAAPVCPGLISIHALLAESDGRKRQDLSLDSHFYPRSPCGERRGTLSDTSDVTAISIHALLAESDEQSASYNAYLEEFLSTLSLRRATGTLSDTSDVTANFYPRSPCGERRRG